MIRRLLNALGWYEWWIVPPDKYPLPEDVGRSKTGGAIFASKDNAEWYDAEHVGSLEDSPIRVWLRVRP